MERNDKLQKIIDYRGLKNQVRKFNEEAYELTEAVLSGESQNKIAEEMADCLVVMKQIQLYHAISDKELESVMDFKISRTLQRHGLNGNKG